MYLGRQLLIILILSALGGCSTELSSAIDTASKAQGHSNPIEMPSLSSLINDQPTEPGLDFEHPVSVIKVDLPSPDRTNPFAISDEYENEARDNNGPQKREIRIVGFIELDKPCVLLSIDGKSQLYTQGETLNNITVNDVTPPSARVTYDGISRSLSLFDHRSKQ